MFRRAKRAAVNGLNALVMLISRAREGLSAIEHFGQRCCVEQIQESGVLTDLVAPSRPGATLLIHLRLIDRSRFIVNLHPSAEYQSNPARADGDRTRGGYRKSFISSCSLAEEVHKQSSTKVAQNLQPESVLITQ